MGDGSGHGGHGGGHGERKAEPTTEIGRMVRDVLAAAPQLTLHARPDDPAHDHGEDGGIGAPLAKLIKEIQAGLDGDMRNPAGLIADCKDALRGLIDKLEGLKPRTRLAVSHEARPHNYLVVAILVALAVVAGAFLWFGAHADVVYQGGSEPDYRQFAYPSAVDAPNLGAWMAWAVLLLALAGAVVWGWGRMGSANQKPREDNARLRKLYEHGVISGDLYDRGSELAPDVPPLSQVLAPPPATQERADKFGRYILALAETYRQRLRMDRVT